MSMRPFKPTRHSFRYTRSKSPILVRVHNNELYMKYLPWKVGVVFGMAASAGDKYDEQDLVWQELKKTVEPSRLLVIHLTKDDGGFGFNIRGGADHPHIGTDPGIFVTAVRQDGAAGRDGRLEVGDRILALNATRLDNISHDDAVDAFRRTEDTVALLVEKHAESYILASPPPTTPGVAVGSPYPTEEHDKPHGWADSIKDFYQSPLGALVLGVAVGSLAILLIRKYRS